MNFTSSHEGQRQITGISDQPLNGTAVINLNKLNTELKQKADADVMINGLSAKPETTTFNTEIAKKPNASSVMLLDGSQSMTGDLNLGNKKAINSAAPSGGTDLCNKTYVDTLVGTTKTNLEKHVNDHLAHSVTTTNLKNDLDYIMNGIEFSDEDDITGKTSVFKDFHKFDKKTKPFDLLDSSKGYYSSRFGVNMYSAAKSEDTVVCEMW